MNGCHFEYSDSHHPLLSKGTHVEFDEKSRSLVLASERHFSQKLLDNPPPHGTLRRVTNLLRALFLLITFLGVGLPVAGVHAIAHEISHMVCEHDHHHDHDEDAPEPCHDPHHHHQCTCAQPLFCLPEIPDVSIANRSFASSSQPERCDWGLPEDPVYALEVPPIIG